jgi:hypothetical protein
MKHGKIKRNKIKQKIILTIFILIIIIKNNKREKCTACRSAQPPDHPGGPVPRCPYPLLHCK